MPENYEAIAHTYSLILLFSRAKVNSPFGVIAGSFVEKSHIAFDISLQTSYRDALIRSFQLAFTLRNISLKEGGILAKHHSHLNFRHDLCYHFQTKLYDLQALCHHHVGDLSLYCRLV